MINLLEKYNFLEYEFIDAIDGRKASLDYLEEKFDYRESFKRYGRTLNKGEVGCTLSHRKSYEHLVCSNNNYALILEDDISIIRDLNIICDLNIDSLMNTPKATILFLSGDYWFWEKGNNIPSVYSAVGAYAYIINKAAANVILTKKAFTVADDWDYIKTYNIRYFAIRPYLIDANLNMDILSTDVKQDQWGVKKNNMGFYYLMRTLILQLTKQVLHYCHHFESKIRVIDNKVVTEK